MYVFCRPKKLLPFWPVSQSLSVRLDQRFQTRISTGFLVVRKQNIFFCFVLFLLLLLLLFGFFFSIKRLVRWHFLSESTGGVGDSVRFRSSLAVWGNRTRSPTSWALCYLEWNFDSYRAKIFFKNCLKKNENTSPDEIFKSGSIDFVGNSIG